MGTAESQVGGEARSAQRYLSCLFVNPMHCDTNIVTILQTDQQQNYRIRVRDVFDFMRVRFHDRFSRHM